MVFGDFSTNFWSILTRSTDGWLAQVNFWSIWVILSLFSMSSQGRKISVFLSLGYWHIYEDTSNRKEFSSDNNDDRSRR